jgi:hypothetical protein
MPFIEEEIRVAISELLAEKAPGPMGSLEFSTGHVGTLSSMI